MAEEEVWDDDFDFGFSFSGAEEVEGTQASAEERTKEISTQAATAVSKELTNDVKSIINKIDALGSLVDKDGDGDDWNLNSDQWDRVEEKVDKILTMQSQELVSAVTEQGSSIRAVIDEVEERKVEIDRQLKDRMEKMEKMIIPLLKNLMKNPSKEYIYWPNRTGKLQKQIDRILAVTRAEAV